MSCSDMPTKMSTKIRYVVVVILLFCFFLVTMAEGSSASQLLPKQKSAMENLYKLLDSQNKLSSWNPNKDPCDSWLGVTCTDDNSTISKLSLPNLDLGNSTFLALVCEIDSLESLDVSRNSLTSIPNEFFTSCGKIGGLKVLNFSINMISGSFPAFNRFTSLESLDFTYNRFSGEIGETLKGLIALKNLSLGKNKLSGPVPLYFGDYKHLTLIDLSSNGLSGSLPSRLGELSMLATLIVSSNDLTGPIPGNLANISSLLRFAANQNQFSGTIPSGISKYLKKLDLSYNKLNGTMPHDLLSNNNLETLDLSSNMLEGSIPENLSAKGLVRLRLGNNSLSGKIPISICEKLAELVYLELENNALSGLIPSELGSCKNLQLLNLAQNRFYGELPVELSNLTKLTVLNLQANELRGKIPSEISKLSNLLTLNISLNHFNGTIPASISSLQRLVSLDLQGNNLSGSIPSGMEKMNSLGEVQLGMNQLSGLIPLMYTGVYSLNLSNNLFREMIPNNLSGLSNLQVLDLSNNEFFGEVPNFLPQLSSLIQLLLANNKLSGTLPLFNPNVDVVIRPGNPALKNNTAAPSTESNHHKRASVGVTIAIVLSAAITGVIVAVLVVTRLRRFYRIREAKVQTREDDTSHFIEGCLLTPNGIHRSNIDFSKAMETVTRGINVVMRTEILKDQDSHTHSEAAYEVLEDSLIGFVATGKAINATAKTQHPDNLVPLTPTMNGSSGLEESVTTERVPLFAATGMSSAEDLEKETDLTNDYKTHKFLDLNKPLLMQVWFGGFSKDFYLEQVHRPRHYKGGESAPLFGNFLEPLSKTPWWVIPVVWLPPVTYGTYLASKGFSSLFEEASYWCLGLFLWTLVEYILHRFLFHLDKFLPDNRAALTLHFLLHGIHHYLPMDKLRLVMPPTLFIALATPFWKLAHAVFYWDWSVATAVFCGGIFGYVCYDLTHYFLHHKTLPSYWRDLKKWHLQHHFMDYENGFGVTSRFWDVIFGTQLAPPPIKKL